MPLQPKDLNEERLLALARSLHHVVTLLRNANQHPWGPDAYLKMPQVRQELGCIEDVLYSYFLGD